MATPYAGSFFRSIAKIWGYVAPTIAGANADGKVFLDVGWQSDSTFTDVIGVLIAYVEGTCRENKIHFSPNISCRQDGGEDMLLAC